MKLCCRKTTMQDIDSSFAYTGPLVKERASSREHLLDLSTFTVRFFFCFICGEGRLSRLAKYRDSGPHPDKLGTAGKMVMINAQHYSRIALLDHSHTEKKNKVPAK